MKSMVKLLLMLGVVASISAGCARDHEEWHETSLLRSIEYQYPEDTIPALNETSNSRSNTQEDRARAIFTLFGRYLQPGGTASDFHRVFTDVNWLQNSRILRIGAYTGWIPVDDPLSPINSVFCLYLFPDGPDKRASQWHIFFRLTGEEGKNDVLKFLQGVESVGSPVKMPEFALCFPHSIYHPDRARGRIERFTTQGVQVYEECGH